MGRRADHTPEQLRALVLDAARKIVAAEGERALTTRRIAQDIGYTSGTLYNVFKDRDDLILALNGATLDELFAAVSGTARGADVEKRLRALARAYIGFVRAQPQLWSLIFEHSRATPEPDWYPPKVARVFGVMEETLAPLYGEAARRDCAQAARMLWASLHGMCVLESKGALAMPATTLVDGLIRHFIAGHEVLAGGGRRKA